MQNLKIYSYFDDFLVTYHPKIRQMNKTTHMDIQKMMNEDPLTCFIIEDMDLIATLMEAYLHKRGHHVHRFTSAEEACGRMAELNPDILYLDWMLPKMSGVELCAHIHTLGLHQIPLIIMITAKTQSEDLETALLAGVDDYLPKPFTIQQFALRTSIIERRARDRKKLAQASEDLQEQRNFIDVLSNSIMAGIFVIDSHTHQILDCNQFALEMTGKSKEDIIGHLCHQLVCPREEGHCPLSENSGHLDHRETVLLTSYGERPILKSARTTVIHGRDVYLETFVDIEDLVLKEKELQRYAHEMEHLATERAQQLIHADRLALLGTMSAGLAHEISNSVTLIGPNVEMLQRYASVILPLFNTNSPQTVLPNVDERKLKAALAGIPLSIQSIMEGVERTHALLASLKGYARRNESGKKPCSINDCIQKTLLLCHNMLKRDVTVITTLPDDLPLVYLEPQRFQQVLVNLINNAVQAMHEKGKIHIIARESNDGVEIILEDNGPGIPEEHANQIWESFFTTKPAESGTGLGLPICKGIIDDHHGHITLVPSSLGGAAFSIWVPQHSPDKCE